MYLVREGMIVGNGMPIEIQLGREKATPMTVTQKKRAILSLLFLTGTALLAAVMVSVAFTLWLTNTPETSGPNSLAENSSPRTQSRFISHSKPLSEQVLQPTKVEVLPTILDNRVEPASTTETLEEMSKRESLELAGPTLRPANVQDARTEDPGVYELPKLEINPSLDSSLRNEPTSSTNSTKQVSPAGYNPIDEDLFLRSTSLEKINDELMPEVRAGFTLGRSGALYAARDQFVSVLRQVAVAKDSQERSDRHLKLLAKGLRALDEAEDFLPRGDVLEIDMNANQIAASHKTPLLNGDITPIDLTAQEAAALYARHAAVLLGEAVANEPAGSMALYGLGKTFARLEVQSKDPTAGQKSNVMYRAAVTSHPENYLAANELGVRLAKSGHYASAQQMLRHAANQPSNATVYENLAAVEQAMGNHQEATRLANNAENIAQRERANNEISRRHGVSWVSPQAFQEGNPASQPTTQQVAMNPQQTPMASPTQQVEQSRSPWRQALDMAKRATNWDRDDQPSTAPSPVVYGQPNTR